MKKLISLCISILLSLTVMIGFATVASAAGSNWPQSPIQLIVPAAPGGDTDLNARLFAEYLGQELGTSIVVVNMNGAAGSIAARDVMDSAPDGYKLLWGNSTNLTGMVSGTWGDLNLFDEFQVMAVPTLDNSFSFIMAADNPVSNVEELLEAAKTREIICATETGGIAYFFAKRLAEEIGIDIKIIDCGTNDQKIGPLLSGEFDFFPAHVGNFLDYFEAGQMKTLGILSDDRFQLAPDCLTLKEQGVDLSFDKYCYMAIDKDVPEEIRATIEQACINATQNAEYYQKSMDTWGIKIQSMNSAEATEMLKNQFDYFVKYSYIFAQ